MMVQMTIEACGLEELDSTAMMALTGGLGGWEGIAYEACKALVICIAESADALIDGARAGWAAAS